VSVLVVVKVIAEAQFVVVLVKMVVGAVIETFGRTVSAWNVTSLLLVKPYKWESLVSALQV